MFEGKYGKALTIGLVILIIVVIGTLIYFTVDFIKSSNINADASDAVDKFGENVNKEITNNNSTKNEEVQEPNIQINSQVENIINNGSSNTDNENLYKGFVAVGTIEIPKIDLKYIVLESATKDSIEVSVAVDSGPGLNKIGNTVIVGHNYRNGTFFSNLKNVSNGDKVYITDKTGERVTYTVYNISTIAPEDSDYMDINTNGKREITLKTCTDDTKSRLIINARED